MSGLKQTHTQATGFNIPGYTDSSGRLFESEVDAICLHYARGNSDIALKIKLVAGDLIAKHPHLTDGREVSEVSHPNLRNNSIILSTLSVVLANHLYNPYDANDRAILKREIESKLNLKGVNLANPGYTDEDGALFDDGLTQVCLDYTNKNEIAADYFRKLVGSYIQQNPAYTDPRQYLDSYTTRQRIHFVALAHLGRAIQLAVEERPQHIKAMFDDADVFSTIQMNAFNLLDLAMKEEGHLTKYDGIRLPVTTAFIDRLLERENSTELAVEIEKAKIQVGGFRQARPAMAKNYS